MFSSYTFKTYEPGIRAERIPDLSDLKTLISARVFSEIGFELYSVVASPGAQNPGFWEKGNLVMLVMLVMW